MRIFVKCQDTNSPPNYNFNEYVIDICIAEKDTQPVFFGSVKFNPPNDSKLPLETKEKGITMWIPEPAECRYETTKGIDYFDMTNNFECKWGENSKDLKGYPCTAKFNVTEGINNFYIRCLDQPWYKEDDEKRKKNREDYTYTLEVSKNALKIDSVTFIYENENSIQSIPPREFIKEGARKELSIEMKIETSGGIENGLSKCSWGIREDKRDQYKFDTEYTKIHNQIISPRTKGTYINYIECVDEAGNKAETVANFIIEIDNTPPVVVRAFHKGSQLKIITNEIAECYYNQLNMCNPFNFENATSMTTALSKEHTADWDPSKTYYIKCKDVWENTNNGCAIVVKPST